MEKAIVCTNCGNENSLNAENCKFCGESITDNSFNKDVKISKINSFIKFIVIASLIPLFFFMIWSHNPIYFTHFVSFCLIFWPITKIKETSKKVSYTFVSSIIIFLLGYSYFVIMDDIKYTGQLLQRFHFNMEFIVFFLYPFMVSEIVGIIFIMMPEIMKKVKI